MHGKMKSCLAYENIFSHVSLLVLCSQKFSGLFEHQYSEVILRCKVDTAKVGAEILEVRTQYLATFGQVFCWYQILSLDVLILIAF